jgi:two-component system, NarL family, sensor histidine kinase UhpB
MNNDPKETVKVLLIEDDRDEATLVKLLLESPRGDDVALEWEESLGGGIERLKRGGFDLILLDLSLTDSTGFETFRRIREQAPGLPIVVLTGLNEKRTVSLVLGAGAQDYLVKGQVNGHAMRRSIRYAMERHQAGGALRESEELYRTLVDTSPDSISMTDLDGTFIKVSRRMLDMHGFDSEDELIGKSALTIIAPEQHASASKYFQETLAHGISENMDYDLLRKDGSRFEGEISASLIKDECGHPRGLIAVVRDVTGMRRAERVALRLSKQIVLEYDRVRTKTAESIHDGVGQSLLGLKMEFEMLRRSDADDWSEGGTEKLDLIDSTLRDIMKEVRRLASDLRPPLLDDFGFVRALEVYVGEFSLSTGILTSFVSGGDYLPMEKEKEVLLFRIAQEALANVRKHSCAKTVEVSLVSGNDDLRLSVRDDGIGFEAENTPSGKRLGILGMQDRAEILGGVLDIASKPGSGTTVTVQVPREQQWKPSMSL